jgi:hypothetical protein
VASRRRRVRLPDDLRPFFWDVDLERLSLDKHRSQIIFRLVEWGSPKAVTWLRVTVGDDVIYKTLASIKARGFSYAKVRRWVSASEYASWLSERPPSLWEGR